MQIESILLRTFLLAIAVSVGMIGAKRFGSKNVVAVEPSPMIDIGCRSNLNHSSR